MTTGAGSRRKGHDWERKVAELFRGVLPESAITRGWQSRSGSQAPDVDGTPFWVECKKGPKPNIRAALKQADEAGLLDPRPSLAVIRDDGQNPIVAMHLDDFLDLVGEWWERGQR